MPIARTVLGDIPPELMGLTYPHEHVVLGYTGAREDLGNNFDQEAVLKQICDDLGQAVRQHGMKTVVDVTPPEVGRDIDLLQEVARRLDINVIAATGPLYPSRRLSPLLGPHGPGEDGGEDDPRGHRGRWPKQGQMRGPEDRHERHKPLLGRGEGL